MELYSLRIQGLRKHCDTTIFFSDSTFLIGENNVGKSSVLVAIDYLLNVKAKIPEDEYYAIADESGNVIRKAQEVVLTAEFRNLPEEARSWCGFKGRIIPYESQISGDSGLSFMPLNGVVSDIFPSASISASANLSDPDSTIRYF